MDNVIKIYNESNGTAIFIQKSFGFGIVTIFLNYFKTAAAVNGLTLILKKKKPTTARRTTRKTQNVIM